MDQHILSDPVTDFWKCSKKVFKNYLLEFFLTKVGYLIRSTKTIKNSEIWHGSKLAEIIFL